MPRHMPASPMTDEELERQNAAVSRLCDEVEGISEDELEALATNNHPMEWAATFSVKTRVRDPADPLHAIWLAARRQCRTHYQRVNAGEVEELPLPPCPFPRNSANFFAHNLGWNSAL